MTQPSHPNDAGEVTEATEAAVVQEIFARVFGPLAEQFGEALPQATKEDLDKILPVLRAHVRAVTASRDAEIEKLRAALKPIEIAGEGSSPVLAPFFKDAAKSPVYWTEMVALLREELASHSATIADLTAKLADAKQVNEALHQVNVSSSQEIRFLTAKLEAAEGDKKGEEQIQKAIRSGVEALMVARAWAMVWCDKFSRENVAEFSRHEADFLDAASSIRAARKASEAEDEGREGKP